MGCNDFSGKKSMFKKIIFGVCTVMTINFSTVSVYGQTQLHKLTMSVEEKNEVYYVGEVTSGVNVRVAAGAQNDKLIVDNQGVVLSEGTQVTILDEVDVSGKPWYHIRFQYGDVELTGYATSTYITKTKVTITPTPLPTPTPKPTSIPTPTIAPTKAPELTASPMPTAPTTDNSNSNSEKPFFIIIAIAGAVIIAGGVYAISQKRKQHSHTDTCEVSDKVDKLKNMVLDANDTKPAEKTKLKTGVYLRDDPNKDATQEYAAAADERRAESEKQIETSGEVDAKTAAANESADKKALRAAIAKLREHDIVIHKYFGKGEVFDNSDVRLIEVRFGQDVRFLNKEQLVNKKLLEITNERRV